MKKRLLALALCLVLVSSLLPVTAAAAFPSSGEMRSWAGGIKTDGTYCGDIYITDASPEGFRITEVTGAGYNFLETAVPLEDGQWKLPASDKINTVSVRFFDDLTGDICSLDFSITSKYSHTWNAWTSNGNGTHSRTCGNGCVDSPQTKDCADTSPADHKCDDCGAIVHTWRFKAAGNTLTGSCGGANCDIGQIVLTLEADSVTLPKSPFETAQLVGWNDFQAVTGAGKTNFVYRYKGPGDERFGEPFEADASKIKAGQYQVGVTITNLPGNVEDGNVAARANTNSAYLFTQYTAADPKVTAQTGDDRPIEIMLVSALAFSTLAAAAFVLDGKRKYRQ